MKDFDFTDKKTFRKENIKSKNKPKIDISEEEKFQRKYVKSFKKRTKEIEEDEKWQDWQDEIY
jgi:exonuclease V gamma subunit